jgi:hypothetical protein
MATSSRVDANAIERNQGEQPLTDVAVFERCGFGGGLHLPAFRCFETRTSFVQFF